MPNRREQLLDLTSLLINLLVVYRLRPSVASPPAGTDTQKPPQLTITLVLGETKVKETSSSVRNMAAECTVVHHRQSECPIGFDETTGVRSGSEFQFGRVDDRESPATGAKNSGSGR